MNEEKHNNALNNNDLKNTSGDDIQKSENVNDQANIDAQAQDQSKTDDSSAAEKTSENSESAPSKENISEEKVAEKNHSNDAPEASVKEEEEKSDAKAENETSDEKEAETLPDYTNFSKSELLDALKEAVDSEDIAIARNKIDVIKSSFYKLRHQEIADLKRIHVDGGLDPNEFDAPKDKDETYLKELLDIFKDKKAKFNAEQEKVKLVNLAKKQEIIEKIKVLANGEESMKKTFEEFRALQAEWKSIGNVPKEEASELWNSYNMQVERFYDFIKINNEMRDLDFKKNLEMKIELCEKAEKLLLEPKIVQAYKSLQDLHDLWKETGPVPKEKRDEIWERFSLASKEINKKHQEHFIQKKEERENNLKTKEALCEKAEVIANQNFEKMKDWNERTNEIMELQKVWKTIGMVPQKHNAAIYERFRSACNLFFDKKQSFFKEIKSEFDDNLQKKIDICVRAEAIQNNTNWNETRDEILKLQEEWKTIGSVPKKQSDEVWKRFRGACNSFFEARDNYFKGRKNEEKENLDKKTTLIDEIKAFKPSEDKAENLKALQNFQSAWTQIGFVPRKDKDKLQKAYKQAIEDAFQGLDMSLAGLNNAQFQKQVDEWTEADDQQKIQGERQRLNQKISKINEDITLWENNMSFFTGSSSGSLLNNVKKKIEKAKKDKSQLQDKRKILDLALRKLKKEE